MASEGVNMEALTRAPAPRGLSFSLFLFSSGPRPAAMGDMKTPDFDDLLAAFDIPDIDANEAIHSGPEDNEGPGGSGKSEPSVEGDSGEATAAAAGDGPGVPGQASDHGLPPADISAVSVIVKNTVCPEQPESLVGNSGGEGARVGGVTKEGPMGPRLMQNGFGGPEPSLPGTPHSPASPSGGTWKEKAMEGKAPLDLFAHFGPEPEEHPDPLPPSAPSPPREGAMTPPAFPSPFELAQENGAALLPPGPPPPLGALKQGSCSPVHPQGPVRPCSGSSPEAAGIPASTSPPRVAGVSFFKQSPGHQSPVASPKVPSCQPLKEEEDEGPVDKSPPGSPQSPSSGAEAADEDSNDSPASSSSSRPLKVRIKTIKTSCGNITRTVTRVPSDPEPPTSLAEGTFLAEASLLKLSPAAPAPEAPKVVSVQLGDGTRLKGTVLPVATIQNASTAMLMAASVARKAVVLPGGTATSPKTMAKNVLGLVPQALPKAEGRAGLGTGGQKVNGASVVMVQPSKPASTPVAGAGTVISRTQSSLVEAFNKILNSKNLLPAYRPNLSPPAEAGLALPPTGYRCLECGDAFSLEKSLARHYDRRSMRIEVTCNHCARRLVFFNKCSLLLHAREHKDKGLVMQCSHLVMRPVALDQMVGQPDITPLLAVPPALGPPALPALGKGDGAVTSPAITTVAAEAPVLPLSAEPPAAPATSTYTCFRCLECKEQCRDKAGMAAHFQQLGPPGLGVSSNVSCLSGPFPGEGTAGCHGDKIQEGVGRGHSAPASPGGNPFPTGVPNLSHDAPQPLQLQRPPAHAQEPAPPRLPRVRGQLPASQLPDPPPGGLPALLSSCGIQVPGTAPVTCPHTPPRAGWSRGSWYQPLRWPRESPVAPAQPRQEICLLPPRGVGKGPLELQLGRSRPPLGTGSPQPLLGPLRSAPPGHWGGTCGGGAWRCPGSSGHLHVLPKVP